MEIPREWTFERKEIAEGLIGTSANSYRFTI